MTVFYWLEEPGPVFLVDLIIFRGEMICLQHFYNIFITNPKWQVITSCYCLGKKGILVLVSNLNQ